MKYGKRYGYWWKQHKILASKINNFCNSIDYFSGLEYGLDKPMSHKHLEKWLKK